MSTVLLIALLGLAFPAMLKVGDTVRHFAFEIRRARAAIEHQTTRLAAIHEQWWTWNQRELADPAEESRRRTNPSLDEIIEVVG